MIEEQKNIANEIAKRIAGEFHPNKIILFGSNAYSSTPKESDLDFLIIKPSSLRRDERDHEIRNLLSDVIYPMDILVYTPEEVKKIEKLSGSFIKKIIETGRVLYEAK